MTTNDTRLTELTHWIQHTLGMSNSTLEVASADASFRRYFRVHHNNKSFIAMDAPPDKEDTRPFVDITRRLLKTGVHAPEIIADNTALGFLLLEDLGSTAYLDVLNADTANQLYHDAMQALIQMQQADLTNLPDYDEKRLLDEMALMPEWFLTKHLGIELNEAQRNIIKQAFEALLANIGKQPKSFVHRDYHSRNLMQTTQRNPGIIDYQDAVRGPVSYDLVSLLRDCYIAWPQAQVEQWIGDFQLMSEQAEILPVMDKAQFLRDFDFMGLQRHIKVLGIFCRLYHRDGKAGYLKDLPLTLSYVLTIGRRYPEIQPLIHFFESLDIPQRIGTVDMPS